jgi:hypothetical protein
MTNKIIRTLEELKKRQTRLHLMQIALKDYPRPANEKKIIAKGLKSELDEINAELSKRIRNGERYDK